MEIANFFDLRISSFVHQALTCYVDNTNDSNSVINLMFIYLDSVEVDIHFILPEFWYSLDYTPLIVNISINKEFIQDKQWSIIRNSEEEKKFVTELTFTLGNIDITDISNKGSLENIVQEYARILNYT